jgi:hypothetical protein
VPCSSSINRYASAFLPQARKFPSRHLLIFPEPLIRVRYRKEDEEERKGRTSRRGREGKRAGNEKLKMKKIKQKMGAEKGVVEKN